ncbi:hypothetical protein XENOCAPTIV_017017 [Xenoophorus captivus]|uniref:Uncharacterized protein n=1 Tax=Xenoophorus captivus TaxID=1517983 RepID=A0ABV0R122_9TELE
MERAVPGVGRGLVGWNFRVGVGGAKAPLEVGEVGVVDCGCSCWGVRAQSSTEHRLHTSSYFPQLMSGKLSVIVEDSQNGGAGERTGVAAGAFRTAGGVIDDSPHSAIFPPFSSSIIHPPLLFNLL